MEGGAVTDTIYTLHRGNAPLLLSVPHDGCEIPKALAACRKQGWNFDIMKTSFFLSRRSLKASAHAGMPVWQDKLFIGLARTSADATEYFQIPTGRVVEIGTQVVI